VLGQGLDLPGGLAGRVAVPQTNVQVLPEHVPATVGAVIQPMSVSYHACVAQGGVGPGDTVLVLGAGSIGDGILLAAKAVGARVVMADPVPARLRAAEQLGADMVINPAAEDVVAAVRRETDGWGADVALEAVGGDSEELLGQAVAATSRGGTVVALGLHREEARVPIDEIKSHEKTLVGSQAYPSGTPARVTDAIASGRLPAQRLITHRLPFAQVEEAFALLESRADDVLKIVLEA
jgi:(R,R)-butanediol dehydrogenase / meso-butanediol dehydrogenase / diacetyl reductase